MIRARDADDVGATPRPRFRKLRFQRSDDNARRLNDFCGITVRMMLSGARLFCFTLVVMLSLSGCSVSADIREDPCTALPKADPLGEFALKKVQQERQLIASKEFDAIAALAKAQLALAKADSDVSERTPKGLSVARYAAETARMKALSSDLAHESWVSVSGACVERLKYPQKEIAAINSRINRLRAMLALSPEEFSKQFKQGTEDMERDYGTPESAARTLKGDLAILQRELALGLGR